MEREKNGVRERKKKTRSLIQESVKSHKYFRKYFLKNNGREIGSARDTHACRSFQTSLNSSNGDTGGESRILSISLVNCDTVSLIFVHDSIRLRSKGREAEGIRFTRLPERAFAIIDNWKTVVAVNARSNCIRGFPLVKRSRLDNKQLSHGKKWKRWITSRYHAVNYSIVALVYKSSEFHPSLPPPHSSSRTIVLPRPGLFIAGKHPFFPVVARY